MPYWIAVALILGLLIVLGGVALRRASRKVDTIIEDEVGQTNVEPEESSTEPVEREAEEPNPDRDWARTFLVKTYYLNPVFDVHDENYREFTKALYADADTRPVRIQHAMLSQDIEGIFATAEILAGVLSNQELNTLMNRPGENTILWMHQRNGRLPRWVPPLLEPSLSDYHDELQRRLRAARKR